MARGIGKVQRTIKTLVSKEFAAREANLHPGPPLGWESTLRWGLLGTVVAFASFGIGVLMPTVPIGIASLALAWVFLILTLLVALRDVGIRKRILLTVAIPLIACYGIVHIIGHPPRSEILEAIRGLPDEVWRRKPKEQAPTVDDGGKRSPEGEPKPPVGLRPAPEPFTTRAISPVDGLTALGWAVTHSERPGEKNELQFSITSVQFPDMNSSMRYLRLVSRPFKVSLNGQIVDLSPLRGIHNFVGLSIASGQMRDLTGLSGLTSLRTLEVNYVGISDLTPLLTLPHLRELALESDLKVTDIGPVSRLPDLVKLRLNATPVRDISALHNTHSIRHIDLRGSRVTDITPLIGIESLEELYIDATQLSKPLVGLTIKRLDITDLYGAIDTTSIGDILQLEELHINAFNGVNLSPFRKLQKLSTLSVLGMGVGSNFNMPIQLQDLAAISELHGLRSLTLSRTQVEDSRFLAPLTNLEELSLNFMPIRDIQAIRAMTNLRKVSLAGVPVVDIEPLLACPNLREVIISQTPARSDVITSLESHGVIVKR